MSLDIKIRPITDADLPFLYTLYATTRKQEFELTHWNDTEKTAFLEMQFNAQHRYYQQAYSGDQFSIILLSKTAIGRLYIGRWEKEIRIIDITISPQYRRQGIGKQILKTILAEAHQSDKRVVLHVEKNNPALSLYLQLGFQTVHNDGVYHCLQWYAK